MARITFHLSHVQDFRALQAWKDLIDGLVNHQGMIPTPVTRQHLNELTYRVADEDLVETLTTLATEVYFDGIAFTVYRD